jgi:hypothetical protein
MFEKEVLNSAKLTSEQHSQKTTNLGIKKILEIKMEIAALIISGLSMIMSIIAAYFAGRANSINKNIFKRQGVIDLHMAWQGINDVDPVDLVGPDIIKAVNALSLTATLWNHDVIEKSILYQSYWGSYKDLYDKLYNLDVLVPGLKKTCRSLMTPEIKKAYKGMDEVDLNIVTQTKL